MDARKKIMFVDDEEGFLKMVKLNLEGKGEYEVLTVTNGNEAVKAACLFRPDMIFLDVIMPEVDGGAVLAELEATPELKHIPVVFLTAILTQVEINAQGGKHVSGRDFLAKPVTTAKLIEYIKKYL